MPLPRQRARKPSSLTVRAKQSIIPRKRSFLVRPPRPTIAALLSCVWRRSFALSMGATTVWTTPPITAPARRSLWKLPIHSFALPLLLQIPASFSAPAPIFFTFAKKPERKFVMSVPESMKSGLPAAFLECFPEKN